MKLYNGATVDRKPPAIMARIFGTRYKRIDGFRQIHYKGIIYIY